MSELSKDHRRYLQVTIKELDRQLGEIEAIAGGGAASLFPRYRDDLGADERQALEAEIAGIRERLRRLLAALDLAPAAPSGGARWGLRAALLLLHDSLGELSPGRLRGYGDLAPAAEGEIAEAVAGIDRSLVALLDRLGRPASPPRAE